MSRQWWTYLTWAGLGLCVALGLYFIPIDAYLHFATAAKSPKPFLIAESMAFKGMPNVGHYGINTTMHGLGHPEDYWEGALSPTTFPNEQKTRSITRKFKNDRLYYVDIEHFVFEDHLLKDNANKLTAIAKWIRSEKPDLRFGFYGLMPITTYWNRDENWRKRNNSLAGVAQYVDYVLPDLYTYYPDRRGWMAHAEDSIAEARKYKKPVYAFLMPLYHPGGQMGIEGQPIPGDYWRLQLETMYRLADGIVIWAWYPEKDWTSIASDTDPNNWWYQTVEFIRQQQAAVPR